MSEYYWIQELANNLCVNYIICIADHFIQVGNGQFISVLFIIPIVIDVHRHRFEIYTLVPEIHENVD